VAVHSYLFCVWWTVVAVHAYLFCVWWTVVAEFKIHFRNIFFLDQANISLFENTSIGKNKMK
jgi:hypothetical protein